MTPRANRFSVWSLMLAGALAAGCDAQVESVAGKDASAKSDGGTPDAGSGDGGAPDAGTASDAGNPSMIVGLNAGGWGPNQPPDVLQAVNAARLDSATDTDVSAYTNLGMQVIVDFSGPYSSGGVSALDANAWAQSALGYYEPYCGGSNAHCPAIEVLNEPSGSWFWGSNSQSSINAAAYANLIKVTHDTFAAKYGANGPKILASYDGSNWWGGVVAADPNVGNYFDGIVVHPYGGHGSLTSSAQGNRTLVAAAHAATGKPVWVTEVGWPTAVGQPDTGDSYQWTEQQQADNIYNFVNWARSTGYVDAVMIFGYRDYSTNMWYGVERWGEGGGTVDGSKKPSFRALYCAARNLPESC